MEANASVKLALVRVVGHFAVRSFMEFTLSVLVERFRMTKHKHSLVILNKAKNLSSISISAEFKMTYYPYRYSF